MVGIFRCQIRAQQASNPQEPILGHFFGKIFGFFQTDSYTLKGSPEEFFLKKMVRHTEKPFLPKFKLSKCYTNEIGPKSKKGETKKWKRVLGGR